MSFRRKLSRSIAIAWGALLGSLSLVGCVGETGAAGGPGSERPFPYRSYAGKVWALRELPRPPEIELEEAPPVGAELERDDDAWRSELTEREFDILRGEGTERPGSGELLETYARGVYRCAACGAPLFSSRDKYHSGTGWPSFIQPYEQGRVDYSKDGFLWTYRIEVHCARCGGHLGHVFNDGPEATGKRYCINSVALDFEPVNAGDG